MPYAIKLIAFLAMAIIATAPTAMNAHDQNQNRSISEPRVGQLFTHSDSDMEPSRDANSGGDVLIINGYSLKLYSDSLSTLTAEITGDDGKVVCKELTATSDTLWVTADLTRWAADKNIICESTGTKSDTLIQLLLGDGPGYSGDPLGAGDLPVRIWHANTNSTGQSYAFWMSTDSQYEDHGSGFVVHNYGKSDGITVSTSGGDDGGCGIGVINGDDYRSSYGISMGNKTGRALIIGHSGRGEAIEIRRRPATGSERVPQDERTPSKAHIFIFNSITDGSGAHPDGHLIALYADASKFSADDSLQLKFTQVDANDDEHRRFTVQVDGDTWTDGSLTAEAKITGGDLESSGDLVLSGDESWAIRCNGHTLEVEPNSSSEESRTLLVKDIAGAKVRLKVEGPLESTGGLMVGSDEDNAEINHNGRISFSGKGGLALPVRDVTPGTSAGTQHEAVIDTAEARIYINWDGDTQWKYVALSDPE